MAKVRHRDVCEKKAKLFWAKYRLGKSYFKKGITSAIESVVQMLPRDWSDKVQGQHAFLFVCTWVHHWICLLVPGALNVFFDLFGQLRVSG